MTFHKYRNPVKPIKRALHLTELRIWPSVALCSHTLPCFVPSASVLLSRTATHWKKNCHRMCKGTGVPRQAEVAQGVPGRLRPRIFMTFRHYKVGRSSAKRTGRLYPRINPWYSLSKAESTSGHLVLSGIPRKKSPVTPPGIDLGTLRLVAQRLNHYATPGPL